MPPPHSTKLPTIGRSITQGFTPLHVAVQNNHPAVVERLLQKGADIEAKRVRCQRPLRLLVTSHLASCAST